MRLVFVILCGVFLSTSASAQSDRGTITGTVSDPANAVIPAAPVAAVNTDTGARFETVSTATGAYTLVNLPAGVYNLEVASAGFAKITQKGIRVQVAATLRIDVKLQVSATSESFEKSYAIKIFLSWISPVSALTQSCSYGCVINTGHGAVRLIVSAVEPSNVAA